MDFVEKMGVISGNNVSIAEGQQAVYESGLRAGLAQDPDYSEGYKDGVEDATGGLWDSLISGDTPVGKAREADHAIEADRAIEASHAFDADRSLLAEKANEAVRAYNSEHAETANNADRAYNADHADEATNASHADKATEAQHSTSADTATSAGHATTATSSATAAKATEAERAKISDEAKTLAEGVLERLGLASAVSGTFNVITEGISETETRTEFAIALDSKPKLIVGIQKQLATQFFWVGGKYVFSRGDWFYGGNAPYANGVIAAEWWNTIIEGEFLFVAIS